MALPALILLLVLTGSNIVILRNVPLPGEMPPPAFAAAAIVRIVGLIACAVALLRIVTGSARPAWRPDAGLWLYALLTMIGLGIGVAAGALVGAAADPPSLLLRSALTILLLAPFAPWMVGATVAVPIGWHPAHYLRDFGGWLPWLMFWSLVIVVPMGFAHAIIGLRLIAGAGTLFWPLALLDGALSTAMALIGFALNAEAYRAVARR